MKLKDKVIVITGAAGNIGAATARRCARDGGTAVLLDRDRDGIEALRAELAAGADTSHGKHVAMTLDVTDPAQVREVLGRVRQQCGPIDVLFANAGIEGENAVLEDYPDEAFEQVMKVNVTGVFYTMKYGEPLMPDGGSIVITSSVAGFTGSTMSIGYSASKHAVIGIMRSGAKHYGRRGIRVNTIHPGMVKSAMLARILDARGGATTLENIMAGIPLKQYLLPDHIADTVAYLASDDSRMVTGQTLVIDAGYMLK